MKKYIIASAALLISLNSFAQFGFIAGLTSSSANVSGTSSEVDSKATTNFHAGVTCKFALGEGDEVFVIQPSLIYNVKGSRLAGPDMNEIKCKTGYIELPVQLQVGIPFGTTLRLYGIAEPFIGYAVSNKMEGAVLKNKWDNISNRFEYGANIGAGLELFEHFQFSVRYSLNLENAISFAVQQVFSNVTTTRKGLSLSVAYVF